MGKAYGFIEITGVVAAMDALDIIEGDVSAVRQAVEAGSTQALKKPAATGVLPNPHPEIVRMVELSASRFKGKTEPSSGSKMLGEDPPDFVQDEKNF